MWRGACAGGSRARPASCAPPPRRRLSENALGPAGGAALAEALAKGACPELQELECASAPAPLPPCPSHPWHACALGVTAFPAGQTGGVARRLFPPCRLSRPPYTIVWKAPRTAAGARADLVRESQRGRNNRDDRAPVVALTKTTRTRRRRWPSAPPCRNFMCEPRGLVSVQRSIVFFFFFAPALRLGKAKPGGPGPVTRVQW